MRKVEKIIGLIAILAIILKFLFIPGSGLLTVVSLMTLAMIYNLLSFALFNNIRLRGIFKKQSYQGLSAVRIIGTIFFGFSISTVVIGILFKLQFWYSASTNLMIGLICLIICLIVIAFRYNKSKADNYKLIFSRTAIIGIFGLLLFLTPQETLLDVLHRDRLTEVISARNLEAKLDNKELQNNFERQGQIMNSVQ